MRNFYEWLSNQTLNESGFARLRQMLVGEVESVDDIGIITSANPNAQPLSAEENNRRMEDLEEELRGMGYGPIRVSGSYGSAEPSFVVPHITREETLNLGRQYEQESVIHGHKIKDKHDNDVMRFEMIMCSDGSVASTRIVSLSGEDIQKRDDFFTQSKGRRFVIPFYDDPKAKTMFGKEKGKLDTYSKSENPNMLHMGLDDVEADKKEEI